MKGPTLLRLAAALPLLLGVLVPAAPVVAVDPAATEAPVQLLELTTPSGEVTEAGQAGIDDAAAEHGDTSGGASGGTSVAPGLAERLAALLLPAANADIDPESDAVVLTDPVEVDDFLVAGFTWNGTGALPEGLSVYLRVRENGAWSEWYLNEDGGGGPDDGAGLGGTEEFITGGADAVQASVVGDAAALPAGLTLALVPGQPEGEEVLDPADLSTVEAESTGVATESTEAEPVAPEQDSADPATDPEPAPEGAAEDPAPVQEPAETGAGSGSSQGSSVAPWLPAALAATTTANGLPVPVHTRAEWGASSEYMTWTPRYVNAAHVVVHHTAGTNNYTASQSASIVRGIYYYHAVTRGWGDIGYNFLVDKYGQVFEGRYGTLSSAAGKMVVGGHAFGANTGTMGISMMGTYSTVSPASTQVTAVGKISGWFLKRAGVDATGSASFTFHSTDLYSAGQTVSLPRITGHRDVGRTSCPGNAGYAKLGDIRSTAQSQINSSSVTMASAAVASAISSFASANPYVGSPLTGAIASGSGAFQYFTNGVAYWSGSTGVQFVGEPVLSAWGAYGWQNGVMGYPRTGGGVSSNGWRHQVFQGGIAYWYGSGPVSFVRGPILTAWGAAGYERSFWGMPRGDQGASAGGLFQRFEHGVAYWSGSTGVQFVGEPVLSAWGAYGWQNGVMGYPRTGGGVSSNGWRHQVFQGGIAYWYGSGPVSFVRGPILTAWGADGYERSRVGMPIADQTVAANGTITQRFEKGSISVSPSGAVTFR